MRFHSSTQVDDERPMRATVNPGGGTPFATIDFDDCHYLRLHDVADCDRLVAAACAAKQRLENALDGAPHLFEPAADSRWQCDYCGMLAGGPLHVPAASA